MSERSKRKSNDLFKGPYIPDVYGTKKKKVPKLDIIFDDILIECMSKLLI